MNSFSIQYREMNLAIQEHSVAGQAVFRIQFPGDQFKPLIITRAAGSETGRFWTSIPEGRQAEAEAIGELISDHLKTK